MSVEFHKMHGAGNDFVVIDARVQPIEPHPAWAQRICDRHFGIGCDQIMILRQPEDPANRVRYEIWNADGSRAGQCGNGARCVALFLELSGEYPGAPYTAESPAGIVRVRRCDDGEYQLDMGQPNFDAAAVPIALQAEDDRYHLDSPWGPLKLGAVSLGNPHCLLLVDDIADERIPAIGAWLDAHPAFSDRVNAGFAQVDSRGAIRLRVIERGPGETLACGSGACAAVALLARWGRVGKRVEVTLPGGLLVIEWPERTAGLLMKGPASHVFRGIMNE